MKRVRLRCPAVFMPVDGDPDASQVRRITLVPFLADGQCVLVEGTDGPVLPTGTVRHGEDYLLDTVLRVPLETAGFRYQRFRSFGLDGDHLYAWIEGDRYTGRRPHVTVPLTSCPAREAADRLRSAGQPALAAAVEAAARSYQSLDDQTFYADNVRRLERSYLRAQSETAGSGFGGDERQWRQAREHITEGIACDGTFLDVGCANGLLMESVHAWCAERGLRVEPYGIDLGAGLVEQARHRLPHWADRIWVGNAIDWMPPPPLRFDFVHVLLDCVPRARRAELIGHHLAHTCQPGGRLLVSQYGASEAIGGTAAEIVRELGFTCTGQSAESRLAGRRPDPTAWLDVPQASGPAEAAPA
jgi:2-polyprenyl-3-methyl-5-hydroxy-6-metoxy-1,4-benzoquinol methylase